MVIQPMMFDCLVLCVSTLIHLPSLHAVGGLKVSSGAGLKATTAGGSVTTATTTTGAPPPTKKYTYKELEGLVNKVGVCASMYPLCHVLLCVCVCVCLCVCGQWTLELQAQEKLFLQQAAQVNKWDRVLAENGDKVGV